MVVSAQEMTMGIDLTLAPIRNHIIKDWWLAYDRLALDREGLGHMLGGLDDSHKGVKTKLVPKNTKLEWYRDKGCVEIKTDGYGERLEYCLAGDMAEYIDGLVKEGHEFTPWNMAVIAMIKALPKETPVVLYWH